MSIKIEAFCGSFQESAVMQVVVYKYIRAHTSRWQCVVGKQTAFGALPPDWILCGCNSSSSFATPTTHLPSLSHFCSHVLRMRARAKQSSKSKSKSRSRKAKITDRNPNQNQNKSPVSNSSRPQQVHFENRAVRGWQFEISKVSNESRGRFERDNTKNSRKFGNQRNQKPRGT